MEITQIILPELILATVACLLMLLGVSNNTSVRRCVPWIAFLTFGGLFMWMCFFRDEPTGSVATDPTAAVRLSDFGWYIKMLASGIGAMLVLVNWPTNKDVTGNRALNYGADGGEFFGLMLLAFSGLMLVASANDLMLLFLAIELASLPTYVMVSVSRPLPMAQEAGVKYFFLGAMSAAIMLFGFSYLYGTTGLTSLYDIANAFHNSNLAGGMLPALTSWQLLAVVMVIAGLAFKLAAVPFHFYAGDVYQGAATPVTAILAFVPKTTGIVALLKILFVAGGGTWVVPHSIFKLIWIMAVLTMTFGNVLGLLQNNVKRVLAYSSIAHSGYLLVAITAYLADQNEDAMLAIAFYLAAYGIMNTGAFAVLSVLPGRDEQPGMAAETFDDIAGQGKRHIALGLAMAVSCFSLIGIPLTIGFFGKLLIIKPALAAHLNWLVILTVVNAAISAAYYLKIIAAMFLRPEMAPFGTSAVRTSPLRLGIPGALAIVVSAFLTLLFGTLIPATQILSNRATNASAFEQRTGLSPQPETPAVAPARQ